MADAPALLCHRESPEAAELDEHCAPEPVKASHAALEPRYAREPARIRYVEYPRVGLFLTPELDAESCQAMVAWFQRWLP